MSPSRQPLALLALAALTALASAACGPLEEPQTACRFDRGDSAPEQGALTSVPLTYSQEGGYYVANVPADTRTVYVLLNGDAPQAPARPVAVAPAPPPVQQVVAEPAPANPFASVRQWRGKYVCTQGLTELAFRVLSVSGPRIEAVFGFSHEESGASGSYRMSGFFDERSGKVSFEPGEWIARPPNYVTVSMRGFVSADGSLFAGRIPHAGCSWFRLQPGR